MIFSAHVKVKTKREKVGLKQVKMRGRNRRILMGVCVCKGYFMCLGMMSKSLML